MNFDIGVVGVSLARKQRFELTPVALGFQRPQSRDPLGLSRFVAFGFSEFDQRRRVLELAFNLRQRVQPVFQHPALTHYLLGDFGINPEIRIFGFRVEFAKTSCRGVDVKDASSAIPRTA